MNNLTVLLRKDSYRYSANCQECRLSSMCLPAMLEERDRQQFMSLLRYVNPLRKNAIIIRQHDPFSAIYMVRSGSVKLSRIDDKGIEQVSGFCFPGEIFGVDGLSTNRYSNSAIAMETTAICRIGFNEVMTLSRRNKGIQQYLFRIVSQKVIDEQEHVLWMAKCCAEQKVVLLLLLMSAKCARLKLSATVFNLPIPRCDIANYLGLTVETTSRIFTRLQKEGLVAVSGKEVSLSNMAGLNLIAKGFNTDSEQA